MVPSLDDNLQALSPYGSLSEKDVDVMLLVDGENLTTFTFDGLKRRLGLHPETLSRILSRLEEEGIVKKTPEGYEVTPKIGKLKLKPAQQEVQTICLLQTFLPSNIVIQNLLSELKGRWFGILRWLGISENSESVTLKWITEDGSLQIAASITGTSLNIDAKFLTSNNLDLALKATYQLMAYVGKILNTTSSATHVAYCPSANPRSYFVVT